MRATDKRDNRLQSLYKSKAKNVDREIIGTPAGERVPVEWKLDMETSWAFALVLLSLIHI